jgi:hypothetical protein
LKVFPPLKTVCSIEKYQTVIPLGYFPISPNLLPSFLLKTDLKPVR